MILSGLCFNAMGAVVKLLALQGFPTPVTALARMAFGLVVMIPWVVATWPHGIRTRRLSGHFYRASTGASSLLFYLVSIAYLQLADAVALSFSTPLWAIPVAVILLREQVRIRRWTATLIGFIGVVIVVRPGGGGFDPVMLLALASALITSFSHAATRQLSETEPSQRIVFYFTLFGVLFLTPTAVIWWQWPTAEQWLWLAAIGFLGYIGISFSAHAFTMGEVTLLTPLDFLRIPSAAVIGFYLFSEIPSVWTLTGSAVIAGSSLYLLLREATLKAGRR